MSDRHSDFESYGIDQLVDADFPERVDGMSLRDWFAGQALAGMRFDNEFVQESVVADQLPEERAARIAFRIADAMLASREQQP